MTCGAVKMDGSGCAGDNWQRGAAADGRHASESLESGLKNWHCKEVIMVENENESYLLRS